MATGIHSRLQTGRTPAPQKNSRLDVVRRGWLSLSPRKRIALVAGLLLLLGGVLTFGQLKAANEPTELYPFAIAPVELRDMSRELATLGLAHELNANEDNLLVAPGKQTQARLCLRDRGLPRARPEHKKREYGPMSPETETERLAALQEDLRIMLRQVEGVADGSVQIAMPPPNYGLGGGPKATAAVKLEMQPGHSLSRTQVAGIVAMVSAAVTGLEADSVQVVDQTGRILTSQAENGEQEMLGSLQASLELTLNQRLQSLLDRCLGPGHAFAQVTVELDTSELEIRKKSSDPNSFVVLQRRSEREEYGAETAEDGSLMSADGSSSGKSYRKICEVTKGEANQSYFVKVDRMPRIARLSCAVALDRSAEIERVRELARGAIGINEERGDFLTVQAITPILAPDHFGGDPPPEPKEASQFSGLALGAGFVLAGLAALFAAGLTPRRLASGTEMQGHAGVQDIRDLRSTFVEEPESTRRVEAYVRQVPNRAAATLKELWLQ